MTDAELFLESIRGLLEGRIPAVDFAVEFNDLYDSKAGADPAQLWQTFEDLAIVAFRYLNDSESNAGESEADTRGLLAAAQSTYDIATDIIRRRGLHNIR